MNGTAGFRVRLALSRARAERIFTAMNELLWPPPDATGLFGEEDGDDWRIDAYFRDAPDMDVLSDLLARHGATDAEPSVEAVPDADWVALSQAELAPVRAGRFLVHGSHDRARARPRRWAIEIDAARAFGTAHHGSTYGCLLALDRLAKRRRFKQVLDLGTGSGVLAIAAARAWRARVIAGDIEPVAVEIARDNARRNRVAGHVRAVRAEGARHPRVRCGAPYDLAVANILARPLTVMARDMARLLRPGGVAVLSGITREQAAGVAAAYTAAGFARRRTVVVGDWVTLILTARGSARRRAAPADGRRTVSGRAPSGRRR